jgi:hypothetical protein
MHRKNMLGAWLVAGCVTSFSPAFAACSKLPFSMTELPLEPKDLLEQVRDMDMLSHSVSNLLIADSRLTLPKVLQLVRIATPEQKKAIGRGMASAVTACFTHEPHSSAAIRDAVRNLRDNELSKAFNDGIAFMELHPDLFSAAPSVSNGDSTLSTGEKDDDAATKTQGHLGLGNDRLWDPFAPPAIRGPKLDTR